MSRDFYVAGESMVAVKCNPNTPISALTNLGLSDGPIRITPNFRHRDILLDAWGSEVPADVQWMLSDVTINISLIHFDPDVLTACIAQSMGGFGVGQLDGQMARAGTRMGAGLARFAVGNHYISLNIYSAQINVNWRFFSAYMTGPPFTFPLGTEKSVVQTNWRAIPYTQDPWGAGAGAAGYALWDHGIDQ